MKKQGKTLQKSQAVLKSKKDDSSNNVRDWTLKKLKSDALSLHNMCHGENSCYNSHDLLELEAIKAELECRGVVIGTSLTFN